MTSRVRLVTNLPCLFWYSTLAWFPSWLKFIWLNAFPNVAGTDNKHWGLSLKWIKSSLVAMAVTSSYEHSYENNG